MQVRLGLWLAVVLILTAPCGGAEESRVVTIPERDYATGFWGPYFRRLLELALEATVDTHGPYEIRMWNVSTPRQERELYELERGGGLDVVWSMTSMERERALQPIRIPLVKGLLGFRIALVRTSESNMFAAVDSLEALRRFTAVQGVGWPDTEILEANGLPVEAGREYEGLFAMLRAGRCDYFPRGITELEEELEKFARDGLAVEPRVLLYYPTAVYFFVRRTNAGLAERLEIGLEEIIRDGRFEAVFQQYNGAALQRANLERRVLIRLENPLLPPDTPLSRRELWYHPGEP